MRLSILLTALLLPFLFYSFDVKCQGSKTLWRNINNETISYDVISPMKKYGSGRAASPFIVIRVNKSVQDALIIERITSEDWLKALEDPKTDWAANLLLYERFNRLGMILLQCALQQWKQYVKEDDLAYWRKKLNTTEIQWSFFQKLIINI